jgi:excisionase family DNA binding protein
MNKNKKPSINESAKRRGAANNEGMRIEEAAAYASMGVSWMRKLIKTSRLPAIRTGAHRYYVIDRCDVDACLEKMKG